MIKIDIYNKILEKKEKIIVELPVILFSIFLFLSLWSFFGVYNIILPPFLTLMFKAKKAQDFRPAELLKNYILILVICILAFLAGRNLILCIILNLFVPFFIVFFLTNKFTPKAYFVYVMAFVFLQLIPISPSELFTRIGALFYSFGILTIGLHLNSKYINKKIKYEKLRGKLQIVAVMLKKMSNNIDIEKEKKELKQILPSLSQLIYSTKSYKYLATEYGKILYWFLIIFQRILYFTEHYKKISEDEKDYFENLALLFEDIGNEFGIENNRKIIDKIESFMKNNSLGDKKKEKLIIEILNLMKLAITQMNRNKANSYAKEWKVSRNKIERGKHFEIFQIRFALRLALVLTFSFSFSFITKLEHAYWVPMSSFLMLMPYSEESKMKMTNRVLGTIGGIMICWLFMSLGNSTVYRIFIIVLMTIFMYTAPITSWTMTMYTTCYGMTLATMALKLEEASLLRIFYVLLAVLITYVANHYILPNTIKREFQKNIKELFEIDRKMLEELKKNYQGKKRINDFRHLMMEHNMLINEIKSYISRNLLEEDRKLYQDMLEINHLLVIEIEQLNSYIYYENEMHLITDDFLLEKILKEIEEVLNRICHRYVNGQSENFEDIEITDELYKKLEENIYFNTLLINSVKNVKELENLYIRCIKKD